MKASLAVIFGFALVGSLSIDARAQILESAGVYSKAGALGAGLGAAAAAGMNKSPAAPPLTPEQRIQAEHTNKALLDMAKKEEQAGHADRAADYFSSLAQWRAQVFGDKDKASQSHFQKAGDLRMQEKGYSKAEVSYRRALTGAVKCYGPGTVELVPVLNKLMSATSAQANYHEAENFGNQVVTLSEREYGSQDARTGKARQQLCGVLEKYTEKLKQENRTEELQSALQRLSTLKAQSPAAEPTSRSPGADATTTGADPTNAQPPSAAGKP